MTPIVMEDPTVSIIITDNCIHTSAKVSSIASEYTIADSEASTILSNKGDNDLLMSLSEVAKIHGSSLEIDLPDTQEGRKDVSSGTMSEGIVEVPNVKDTVEKMNDESSPMQIFSTALVMELVTLYLKTYLLEPRAWRD